MNAKVEKTIKGHSVAARPVYKGNAQPAYWTCIIDQRVQPKTFTSATDVFKFVENRHNN